MNKEQLKSDIQELRDRLTKMENQLLEPEKFEFRYKKGNTCIIGAFNVHSAIEGSSPEHLRHGDYRKYKENAEETLQLIKETKLIGAIAEQVSGDDDWMPNWSSVAQEKYFVYLDAITNKYSIDYVCVNKLPGLQYFSESTAEKVCQILNAGQVSLK